MSDNGRTAAERDRKKAVQDNAKAAKKEQKKQKKKQQTTEKKRQTPTQKEAQRRIDLLRGGSDAASFDRDQYDQDRRSSYASRGSLGDMVRSDARDLINKGTVEQRTWDAGKRQYLTDAEKRASRRDRDNYDTAVRSSYGERAGTRRNGVMLPTAAELNKRKSHMEETREYEKGLADAMKLLPNERAGVKVGTAAELAKNAEGFADQSRFRQDATTARNYLNQWDKIRPESKGQAAAFIVYGLGIDDKNRDLVRDAFMAASDDDRIAIYNAAKAAQGYTEDLAWMDDHLRDPAKMADESYRGRIELNEAAGEDIVGSTAVQNAAKASSDVSAVAQGQPSKKEINLYRSYLKGIEFSEDWARTHDYSNMDYFIDKFYGANDAVLAGLMDSVGLTMSDLLNTRRSGYLTGNIGSIYRGITEDDSFLQTGIKMASNVISTAMNLVELPVRLASLGISYIPGVSDSMHAASQEALQWTDDLRDAIDFYDYKTTYAGWDKSELVKTLGNIEGFLVENVPAIALTIYNPKLGQAMFGAQAGGNYGRAAYESGATLDEAVTYGTIAALAEVGTGKLFPMAGTFGKSLTGEIFGTITSKQLKDRFLYSSTVAMLEKNGFANSMEGRILKGVLEGGGEATEEMIMEIVNPYLQRAIYDEDAPNATLEEIVESGLYGAAVAAVLHLPANTLNAMGDAQAAFNRLNYKITAADQRNDMIKVIRNEISLGLITEEQAKERLAKAQIDYEAAMEGYDIATGRGSLRSKQRQTAERKVDGNENAVYSGLQEAQAAVKKQLKGKDIGSEISVAYAEGETYATLTATKTETGIKTATEEMPLRDADLYGEKARKLKRAKNETERSGIQLNVREEIVSEISDLSEAIGRDIVFEDVAPKRNDDGSLSVKRGWIDDDGVIHVNVQTSSPAATVVAHELTHLLEGTVAYRELQKSVYDYYKHSTAAEEAEVKALYGEIGVKDPKDITSEVMALFVEKKLLTDKAAIHNIVKKNRTVADRFVGVLNRTVQKLAGNKEQRFLAGAQKKWAQALKEERTKNTRERTEKGNKKSPSDEGKTRYAMGKQDKIDATAFADAVEQWDKEGRPDGERFDLGQTGDVLQELGAYNNRIYMDSGKINENLGKHPKLSLDEIKQIPYIINDPVLILNSKNPTAQSGRNSRIVMMGDVQTKSGDPVVVILDLRPVEDGMTIIGIHKVTSVYAKDTNPYDYVRTSEVLYIGEEKRAVALFGMVGFQMPIKPQHTGSIGSISYQGKSVKITGVPFSDVVETGQKKQYAYGKESDAEYMAAVERGDMETAQRMVDAAAEEAMKDSKIRDEDGNLLAVYHGTEEDFTVFDMSKGRANMDIQGSFFSPWDDDAAGYGRNVRAFYLNIINPASEQTGYKALNNFKGQNYAGKKAAEKLKADGYDGVNNDNEEYIAFYPEQIKSADPVTYDENGEIIPLSERFDENQRDFRFAYGREDGVEISADMHNLIDVYFQEMENAFHQRSAQDRRDLWQMVREELDSTIKTGAFRSKNVREIVDFAYDTGYLADQKENAAENTWGGGIYVSPDFRGEMDSLGGLQAVNRSMLGSGIYFTYSENKKGTGEKHGSLDEAYQVLRAKNQVMKDTADPSEQVAEIMDLFGNAGNRQMLRDLDEEEGLYSDVADPYRAGIEEIVERAFDDIATLARAEMFSTAYQEGEKTGKKKGVAKGRKIQQQQAEWMREESRSYFVGDTVELDGERGTIVERRTTHGDIVYTVELLSGERKKAKPEELTVGVTPIFAFDELPDDIQDDWLWAADEWDMADGIGDTTAAPMSMKEFSQLLFDNGVTAGVRKLTKWFQNNGYISKSDSSHLLNKGITAGLMEKKNGKVVITEKGQQYFLDLLTHQDVAEEFLDLDSRSGIVLPGNDKDGNNDPTELTEYVTMTAEYEEELGDTGDDYSWATVLTGRGVSDSKDYARNFDVAAQYNPTLRKHLQDLFVKPLETAKAEYAADVRDKLNETHDKMEELGIRMGSKESQAVQWYGEGFYMDRYGEQKEYTLEMLKQEFPKTWENIVEASQYFREMYDEYLQNINRAREKIYPHPLEDAQDKLENYEHRRDRAEERIGEQRATISNLETVISAKKTEYQKAKDGTKKKEKILHSIRYNEDRLMKAKRDLEDYISRRNKYDAMAKSVRDDINSGDVLRNKRIMPRKDYFHHFQELTNNMGDIFFTSRNAAEIDPRMEGTSAYTEPKSKWSGILAKRNGGRYKADAIEGFIKYVQAGEYMIHIDPVIAEFRNHIKGMAEATKDTRNCNKLIRWLVDWTNDLAGKTNPMDRWLQNKFGRVWIHRLRWLNSRAKANAVLLNIGSAVVQVGNIPNMAAYVHDPRSYVKGLRDLGGFVFNRKGDDGTTRALTKRSGFLNERYLDDSISQFGEKTRQKPERLAAWTITVGDRYSTTYIWLAAYNDATRKGHENPVEYADDIARRCVAGRGIGEIPLTQKSFVTQVVAPFQIEVNNAFELYKETIKKMKYGRTKKERTAAPAVFGKILIMNFIFNTVFDLLLHKGRPLYDPIYVFFQCAAAWIDADDDEKEKTNWRERFVELLGKQSGELISNIPFGSLLAYVAIGSEWDIAAIFGDGDENPTRYGVSPLMIDVAKDLIVSIANGENIADDLLTIGTTFALPFGGKQLERMIDSLHNMGYIGKVEINPTGETLGEIFKFSKNEAPGVYDKNGNLQFPVETFGTDPMEALRGFLFGAYATDAGREYLGYDLDAKLWEKVLGFDKDQKRNKLNERATTMYKELVANGADPFELYDAIIEVRAGENDIEKRNVLLEKELTDEEKNAIILNVITASNNVESEAEKLSAILNLNLTTDDYLKIKNAYAMINKDESLKGAEEKTSEFFAEMISLGYTEEQLTGINEVFGYYSHIPQKFEGFTDLVGMGMDKDTAFKVNEALKALEPLDGASSVSALQRVECIAGLDLSAENEKIAMRKALTNDKSYAKYLAVNPYGVTAQVWADYEKALQKANDENPDESKRNSGFDMEEKEAALASMNVSNETKAALWQMSDNQIGTTKHDTAWKAARNPYNSGVGAKVVDSYLAEVSSMEAEKAAEKGGSGYNRPLPTDAGSVSSEFGNRVHPISGKVKHHDGIDIAAPAGTPVLAAADGEVVETVENYSNSGYGNRVVVKHADGSMTTYNHMSSFGVKEGDILKQGEQIGEVGSTGASTGNHLHFEYITPDGALADPRCIVDFDGKGLKTSSEYVPVTSGKYTGGSSGGSKKSSSGSKSSRSSQVAASRRSDGFRNGTSGNAGYAAAGNGSKGVYLPTASQEKAMRTKTPGTSVKTATYAKQGVMLPTAADLARNENRNITYNTRGRGTQATPRTATKNFWDDDVLA